SSLPAIWKAFYTFSKIAVPTAGLSFAASTAVPLTVLFALSTTGHTIWRGILVQSPFDVD
ncbi:MAG: hypothetical protein VXZ25_12505, partial [Pseudomonadota bacterium]|nr:hypothetical protein [Pseudomonadota bacterium]